MLGTVTAAELSPAKPEPRFAILKVAEIAPDPYQPRRHFDEEALQQLAVTIAAVGVIEPIIVRPAVGTDSLLPGVTNTLVAGERRWRAAQIAGLTEIPALIRDDLVGIALTVIEVLENLQRAGLSLAETVDGVAKLVEAMGAKKTAEQLGMSEAWVSKHVGIGKLPEEIRELIDLRVLESVDMAHDLARLIQLPCMQWHKDRAMEAAGAGTLTRADLRQRLSNAKEEIDRAARQRREQAEREASWAKQKTELAEKVAADPELQKEQAEQQLKALQLQQEEEAREAETDRRHEALSALKEQLKPIQLSLLERMAKAIGVEVKRYADTNEIDAEYEGWDDPIGIDLELPFSDEPAPIPENVDECFLMIHVRLPKPRAEELVRWLEEPLEKPKAKTLARNASPLQQADEVSVGSFIKDDIKRKKAACVTAADFRAGYERWCAEGGYIPLSANDNRYGRAIIDAKIEKKRLKTGYVYLGIALKPEA